jgi:gamma-resorcylate decarboxylase
MQRKIAVEEHFAIPETIKDAVRYPNSDYWANLGSQLLDIHDKRLVCTENFVRID